MRRIGLAVLGLTLLSLVVPATRELHLLNLRLLLRLRGENTVVYGQPAGCAIYIVPTVRFNRAFYDEKIEAAGRSPEDFLLASAVRFGTKAFPPATTWRGHPLRTWAVTLDAGRTWRFPRPTATSPVEPPTTEFSRHSQVILDTIREAQVDDPDNAVLWLAEAKLLFEQGRNAEAVNALALATTKPRWVTHNSDAFRAVRGLLMRYGLPDFDASTEAHLLTSFDPSWNLLSRLGDHLVLEITRAVIKADDATLAHRVGLTNAIRRLGREKGGFTGRVFLSSPESDNMVAAMATSLGRTLPGDKASYAEREKARQSVFADYLKLHANAELMSRIEAEGVEQSRQIERLGTHFRATQDALVHGSLRSSMLGMLSLLWLSLFAAGVLGDAVITLIASRWPPPRNGRQRTAIIALVALTLAAMTCVVFLAWDSTNQPVGLRDARYRPRLTPNQENLLFALVWAVILAGLRWLLSLRNWTGWFRAALLGVACLYLAAVSTNAYVRHTVVEVIAASYPM